MKRRRVLTALGATGAAAFAGLGFATDGPVRYTMASTEMDCDDFTLEADWRETYDQGDGPILLENTTQGDGQEDKSAEDPSVINLGDVLPEDSGVFSFRLELDTDSNDVSVTPELTLVLEEVAENRRNEPEREAGDADDDQGELQDFIDVAAWEDTGLMDIDAFGANNGEQNFGEGLLVNDDNEEAEGTLRQVATCPGLDLDPDCGGILDRVTLGELDGDGATTTVSFGWEFDSENGPENIAQTDSVRFTFDIHAKCTQ